MRRKAGSVGDLLSFRGPVAEAMERAVRHKALLEKVVSDISLELFREWLLDGVTHVSSMVPAVLVDGDGDRSVVMHLLRPTSSWPSGPVLHRMRRPRKATKHWTEAFGDRPLGRVSLYPDLYDVDRIGLEVVDRSVEIFAENKGNAFATRGGRGILRIPGALPDAAAAACVGRPLEQVVAFPLLGDQDLVVDRVVQQAGHTLVEMKVEALPISEWPDAVPF